MSRSLSSRMLARGTTLSIATVLASAALLAGGLALDGCSDDSGGSSTAGARIKLKTVLTSGDNPKAPVANSVGWTITLQKAFLSTGALIYYDGSPIFTSRDPMRPRSWDPLGPIFGIKKAHAHPGHYIAGDAKGQMLVSDSVDLLAGPQTLATGDGVTGVVRSARFTYGTPPTGKNAASLEGHVVVLEGTATNGTTTIKFKTQADVGDVVDTFNEPKVEGCTFTETTLTGDGTVTVLVKPSVWLDQADFTGLTAPADGSALDIAGTEPFNAFSRGLKKGTAYLFSYSK